MGSTRGVGVLLLLALAGASLFIIHNSTSSGRGDSNIQQPYNSDTPESGFHQLFLEDGLRTDTSRSAIDLTQILDGGPGKDGIPALIRPKFISLYEATQRDYIDPAGLGIIVELGGEARYYPYSILNRHEIVNDELAGYHIAVTFCPLCGSAIVFDRQVDGGVLQFGVSGKLYESNLLMYDDQTETLWSQSQGKGVVGAHTNTTLNHIDSDVMSFEQFRSSFPTGVVLSDQTGWGRDYARAPYDDYDSSDILYFPVSDTDSRLPKKELLYVVNDQDRSIAFVKADLVVQLQAELIYSGDLYKAVYDQGEIEVTKNESSSLPGYHEMWFSRVTHNPHSKSVWTGNE